MLINQVIDILNKEFGYDLKTDYYIKINQWEQWWRGYYKSFHHFIEKANGKQIERRIYSLGMAKKVCEDWAAILLNEKTLITVDDEKAQVYLTGKNDSKGLLQKVNFWTLANRLVEKAFYSGTGAILVDLDNMLIKSDGSVVADKTAQIKFEYIPASGIIPLTVSNGNITEAAFVSEKIIKGKQYAYVQMITKQDTGYQIENRMYLIEEGALKTAELPKGILPVLTLSTDIPPFAIIEPNIENNIINNQGLGISIYANAIDNLKGVDLAFNNLNRDFKLGGKKVFISEQLMQTDSNGQTIAPDDVAQQLFSVTSDVISEDGTKSLIQEYNPQLRVEENKNGIQSELDYLSFKVGFGTKHYQFNGGSIVTATQYSGDKQELVQNASKHYIIVENALISLTKFILWAAKNICGADVNPDANITIQFEDSYIIDKESERNRDAKEVSMGVMQLWEYRMKWYGEDEATAKKMVATDEKVIE